MIALILNVKRSRERSEVLAPILSKATPDRVLNFFMAFAAFECAKRSLKGPESTNGIQNSKLLNGAMSRRKFFDLDRCTLQVFVVIRAAKDKGILTVECEVLPDIS
jgi:hypothetical protein